MTCTASNAISYAMKLNASLVKSIKTAGIPEPPDDVVRESVALYLFQKGLISMGKAAELSNMGLARFMDLLQSLKIPQAEYSNEDLAMDLATMKKLKGGRRRA